MNEKTAEIGSQDLFVRMRASVLESEMAYIDEGDGDPIVFVHGNITSSYLWRNVIPHIIPLGRCLAPDLIGMGRSAKLEKGTYGFFDHARYFDAWMDAVGAVDKVTLVVHDWGGALAFHWARRFPERVKALVYMETVVRPYAYEDWPELARPLFQMLRSPAGEELVLGKPENAFVERAMRAGVMRTLTEEEMDAYHAPFLMPGPGRLPLLQWPRQLPWGGEPQEVVEAVEQYSQWLTKSERIPKLFINAEPGFILTGAPRDFCRTFPNQTEVTVKGVHYVTEDSPIDVAAAIAAFLMKPR